jgi:hypothetical protein
VSEVRGVAEAEAEVLELLNEIRRVVLGNGNDTEGTDAIRAVLRRLFEKFVLHTTPPAQAHVELIDSGFWIEPIVNEQAIAGYDENIAARAAAGTACSSSKQIRRLGVGVPGVVEGEVLLDELRVGFEDPGDVPRRPVFLAGAVVKLLDVAAEIALLGQGHACHLHLSSIGRWACDARSGARGGRVRIRQAL